MKREEQRIEDTWALEDIYANEELFAEELNLLKDYCKQLASMKGTLGNGPEVLLEMIQIYEKVQYYFGRVLVYSNERFHENMANSYYQSMCSDVNRVMIIMNEACSYIDPEVLSIADKIDGYYEACPKLKEYQRFIDSITYKKDHILDEKTEALLARTQDLANAGDIFGMLNNADIRFPDIVDGQGNTLPLTLGNFVMYLTSKDAILRKNAFEGLYHEFGKYNNTLGAMYIANMKQANFYAEERNFNNALEAALFENEIPVEVYDQLLEAIHDHIGALNRYVGLRKKILNTDDLHWYDIYVPLSDLPVKKYSFEEGKKMVLEGLQPLGKDYIDILQEGFNNRWIDVYENEGKESGAHSWGCYGTHPYVLLNYTGTLDEVFCIAHEMGHALHTYHSDKHQPILTSQYRIFVAEVASTCNEALLINYLLNNTTDKEEKKYLINYFLDSVKGTIFRQALFAEFEKISHGYIERGESVTANKLNEIYLDLNKFYYGPDMNVDDLIKYEWSRIPHYYSPFYMYQYSTGFAAAIAIATKILKGEEGIVEKYKQFLSSGGSMSPIDLLKICDVDMSTREPVDAALVAFEQYLDELEKLI